MTQWWARDKETIGNTFFLRKKKLHKRENGFAMNFQKYRSNWWIVLWSIWSIYFISIYLFIFFIFQNAYHARQKKHKKKNEYSHLICPYKYIPKSYVTKMTQNKNDSINSILQYRRLFDKNCCAVFPASVFPYLILRPRQCKG